jgi:Branched-chain amino acid ABC-type transport system, permease components
VDLHRRRRALGPGRRRDGTSHGPLAVVGSLYIAKAFITVITGGAAIISGTLASSVIFGAVNQIVSFGSTPVIGEIAMLALAIILLRLMPQGITGRFFRNST